MLLPYAHAQTHARAYAHAQVWTPRSRVWQNELAPYGREAVFLTLTRYDLRTSYFLLLWLAPHGREAVFLTLTGNESSYLVVPRRTSFHQPTPHHLTFLATPYLALRRLASLRHTMASPPPHLHSHPTLLLLSLVPYFPGLAVSALNGLLNQVNCRRLAPAGRRPSCLHRLHLPPLDHTPVAGLPRHSCQIAQSAATPSATFAPTPSATAVCRLRGSIARYSYPLPWSTACPLAPRHAPTARVGSRGLGRCLRLCWPCASRALF